MVQADKKSVQQAKKTMKPQDGLIFALDIGTRTVVGITGEQNDDGFVLTDCVVEPHTKRAMIDGQIEDIKQVSRVVARVKERLEESGGVRLSRVSIAAAGRALNTRRVTMDFDISAHDVITQDMVKSMELEAVHKAQIELDKERGAGKNTTPSQSVSASDDIKNSGNSDNSDISSNSDNPKSSGSSKNSGNFVNSSGKDESDAAKTSFYCVGHSVMRYMLDDYAMISLEGHKGQKASVELIATFLPNVVVEGLYSVMDANSLEVESLTLEPIAAMNAVVPNEIRLINIALVDIGAGTSDIAISRDGTIVAYAMATIAGDEITEEIIRTFFVDFATAESMKHASTSGVKEFEYRDIFGIKQKVKTDEFLKKLDKSINTLVDTICTNIISVNGASPSAVFLVGGGALIGGLAKKTAKKLGLDENRVAIGSNNVLRSVDTGGKQMGAEFITPLGIALTSILNRGYDFSLITLNDEKIRIFDTKKLTVFDVLTIAGYKSVEIMGRSGRNLTFAINGKHKTIRGGNMKPAEIQVNGKNVSINSGVSQGDSITFIPAECGENARATVKEAVEFLAMPERGFVTFSGKKYETGAEYYISGVKADENREILPLENIEIGGILTLGDLLQSLDSEVEGVVFTINGEAVSLNCVLHDGDIIGYDYELSADKERITAENRDNGDKLKVLNGIIAAANESEEETVESAITITFNGDKIILPPSKNPHLFLELLNYIEIDRENPNGNYKMLLNGEETGFNTMLKDGDVAVLEWK